MTGLPIFQLSRLNTYRKPAIKIIMEIIGNRDLNEEETAVMRSKITKTGSASIMDAYRLKMVNL